MKDTHTHTHTHAYSCKQRYTDVNANTDSCIHTHTHTHTHKYRHLHTDIAKKCTACTILNVIDVKMKDEMIDVSPHKRKATKNVHTDNVPTPEMTLWIIGPKEEQLVGAVLTAGSPGPELEPSYTTVSLTGCKVTGRPLEPTERTGRW